MLDYIFTFQEPSARGNTPTPSKMGRVVAVPCGDHRHVLIEEDWRSATIAVTAGNILAGVATLPSPASTGHA